MDDLVDVVVGDAGVGLQLDQDVAANKLCTVGRPKVFALVHEGKRNLAPVRDGPQPKFGDIAL